MPLVREYYPSDTLKLINQSEHKAVRGGLRGTWQALGIEEKKGAHSIGRHLVKSRPEYAGKKMTTGSLGQGVAYDDFRDRFLDAPDNLSSAWAGKGEMAVLLCELLNSDLGQYALGLLAGGQDRVMVHYFNEGKLRNLFGGLVGMAQFLESAVTVTPAQTVFTKKLIFKPNGEAVIDPKTKLQREIMERTVIAKSSVANVKAKNIIAVNAVLDAYGGGSALHLQTFFPASDPDPSFCEWSVGVTNHRAAMDHGAIVSRIV